MIWMPMYIHVIFSYLAAVGFAVFLNSPKKTLYVAGGIGMISLARKMKKPTILFIVPGIITLIPGLGLYNTMSYVVDGDFQLAFTTGANVLLASGAIALGVIVISSLFRTYYKNLKERLHINKAS